MKIAIFGNRHQEDYLGGLKRFFRELEARGFYVCVERRFGEYLLANGVEFPRDAELVCEIPAGVEYVVSIGGDGTFLRAAQWVSSREIPILGVNTGHLGFLAGYSLEETEELAEVLLSGCGLRECRSVLELRCDSLPEGMWPYALNEVAVMKCETSSMMTVHAEIDGHYLADYLADGLVVSTPTGSTAYNLSAGGPILQPTLGCIVLSPVAPHSLTMRPLVVSGESEIRLIAQGRSETARVSLDGRSFMLEAGREMEISKAAFHVIVLRRPETSFSELLRDKLLWGRR